MNAPILTAGPARVTWAATGHDTGQPLQLVTELGPQDKSRAAGFGDDRRREFMAGRSLVAALVASLFPDASGWSIGTATCVRCGERHGAPELTGVAAVAGVSYARGLVVAAVASSAAVESLGVDVELDAADTTRTRDLERLLGRSRLPVLRRWTRIEAVLKSDGRGLLVEPGDVSMRGDTASIAGSRTRHRYTDVAAPAGYLISLAWCEAGSSAASSGPATG